MNTGKINLRNIIILLGICLVISFLLSRFYKGDTRGKDYAKQRALFAYFIDKSVHTKDYTQFNTFIHSCRNYTDSLPPSEIDSLKSFLGSYMKFNDDVYTDIINSVKDSGMIDTTHAFRPATLAEARQICIQSEKQFANWQKGAYSLATMAQQQRNALPNNGNPWDVTDLYKQKLTVTRIRRDSLYRQFYNGVFVLKK